MKILIAPNTFKECLTASQVAYNIENGIKKHLPNTNTTCLPLSDGGDGLIQAILHHTKGEIIHDQVHNPIGQLIKSPFAITHNKTAIIESASIIGLNLLSETDRNPLLTSSYGLGEMIISSLNNSCKEIIIGIGGSATNDCGTGMLSALGVKFLNSQGDILQELNGSTLKYITHIDTSGIDKRIFNTKIIVACDVQNPLTGSNGASQVYAPQKGASKHDALLLDNNVKHFASVIKKQLGTDVEQIKGSGAAGGLGAGLLAFTNAELHSGFNIIANITNLETHIQNSDIVFTGEGRIDGQTKFGKVPFGIAKLCKQYNKPLVAICGQVDEQSQTLYEDGFTALLSIINKPMLLNEAMQNAPQLLAQTAENAIRLITSLK